MLGWAGSGLSELAPSCISIHLSSPEVPTPRGLLSPMRGIAVSSLALVEIPIQLGMAMIVREGQGRLPLFEHMLIPLSNYLCSALGNPLVVP